MNADANAIPGYTYGSAGVAPSPVSLEELEQLKLSVGMTEETERSLKLAGEVLADQTQAIVEHWRGGIIAGIPHLARHSRAPDGSALPEYLKASNLRFQQWILDTCMRPMDQDWLNYQQEIALRHRTEGKNRTDGVVSTPYVPFRDILAFSAVMNETIKPYLAAKGHSSQVVEQMHQAWCKALQLQLALWARTYMPDASVKSQW